MHLQLTISFTIFHYAIATNFTSIDIFDTFENYTVNQNISQLLDSLLKGYDYHIRPDLGEYPIEVLIDIEVRSMGTISEIDMTYSMDCYFRQMWLDRRLAFEGAMDDLALSVSMLEKIWKPDTFFFNGKMSYLHTITTPNKFVRISKNGTILYSSRLTIQADCPMNLENFPMDTQRCPLKIGSFGYATTDVVYIWNPKRRVVTAPDMKLSQFDLISTLSANTTEKWGKATRSLLMVSFHLQRHMGYFLIEVYAPCTMLVVLSYLSFWINREATADRVALGVMTMLTMTFLGLESRNDLPKVPYCTALDFFVAISFGFVFSTIVEFAIVHLFTKVGSGEYYFPPMSSSDEDSDEEDEEIENTQQDTADKKMHASITIGRDLENEEEISALVRNSSKRERWKFRDSQNGRLSGGGQFGNRHKVQQRRRSRHFSQDFHLNSVSRIDKAARVIFPLVFIVMNFIYWKTYLGRDS